MSDQNHISPFEPGSGNRKHLPEDKLLAYLEGKLPPAEQHEVEQWLAEEGMESDALEGLQTMRPEDTRHTVNKLNHNLRKTLLSKKHKRTKLKTDQHIIVAIAIILLLVVVAYIVVSKSI